MAASKIWTRVDYEKDGKQVGWLNLPHSVNRSAYGNIAIPITCIKNGKGPTVLLMSGTHGDEYEGQVTMVRLIQDLEPSDIKGRIIILPAANLPAAIKVFYEVFPQTRPANVDEAELVRRDAHIMNAWFANAKPRPGAKFGTNYEDMWEFSKDYYTKNGMLKSPKPVSEAMTNRFIEDCNRFDAAAIEKQAKAAR